MKPYIDYSLDIDEYHAHNSVSRSTLSDVRRAKTPAHFKVARNKPKDSEALRFGNAFHKFLLEPDIFEDNHVLWSETKTCGVKFKKAEAELDDDQFLVVADWMPRIETMSAKILEHPKAHNILSRKGNIEASYFWKDPEYDDLQFRCRPDFVTGGYAVDIKKTENSFKSADQSDFWKHVVDFDYDIQAYMTHEGHRAVTGEELEAFIFVVCEDSEPYGVNLFVADDETLALGEMKFHKYARKYQEFKDSDDCYDQDVKPIAIPEWYLSKQFMED